MRLRRLEMVILALTVAFAFFMGGFFTGRSTTAVSITPAHSQAPAVQIPAQQQLQQDTIQQDLSQQAPAQQDPAQSEETQAAEQVPGAQSADNTAADTDIQQATGAPKDDDGKININTAGAGELTDLPGIGNVIASRIIDYRTQNGAFTHIEDIKNVAGIGEKRFEAIENMIKVG